MPVIPALWEAEVGRSPEPGIPDQPGQHAENLSLPKTQKNFFLWAWWRASVVPATGEAEVGGSLEPGRSRLQ